MTDRSPYAARDGNDAKFRGRPKSVETLTKLGRVRLSKNFLMREMLHSEIAEIHGLCNVPDDPDLAIEVGTRLCEELLEPIQAHWGRISIRSAYRSAEVNELGWRLQNEGKSGYNCASNESNYAGHIWDRRDAEGRKGATACIVVPAFWDRHREPGDWQIMARWIRESLPYSSMFFFPTYWAFNITWSDVPKRRVQSYAAPKGDWHP